MKNTIVSGVLKYWWAPVSIFILVILGLVLKQQSETLYLQSKVMRKSFKFHMLREKVIYDEEQNIVGSSEVPFPRIRDGLLLLFWREATS
jgi:hypothetical protein